MEALGRLLERFRPGLRALVQIQLGPSLRRREDVDDLVQQVCLNASQSLGGFKWLHDESFPRWLSGIALNVIKNRARYWKAGIHGGGKAPASFSVLRERGGMNPNEVALARTVTPMRAMAREERFERLVRAIESLSPDQRQAILLARIEGLPLQEVGVRMERSRDAVSMLIRRAVEQLRMFFRETSSLGLPDRNLRPEPRRVATEVGGVTPEVISPRPQGPDTNEASAISPWLGNLPNLRNSAARIAGCLSCSWEGAE